MKVGIIGANGYSGIELIRFIDQHPFVSLEVIVSHSHNGVDIRDLYPHLHTLISHKLEDLDIDQIAKQVDLLFFATPSGISKDLIPEFYKKSITCIDVSGDFRLKDPNSYEKWYNASPADQELLNEAVYGLADVFKDQIPEAKVIANPGCYPTATLLGLIPAVEKGILDPHSIIIDGKSGVSGAGRKASIGTLFAEVNENVKAYKLGEHQHIPEIEQTLEKICGEEVKVTFSTHLIPMTRGIMCTIYATLTEDITVEEVIAMYKDFYKDSPFVRIRPIGEWPATKEVYGSNYCDIGFMVDCRTNRLTIISVIDNIVKGASGQAIQNMNLLYGWDEKTGLEVKPIYP